LGFSHDGKYLSIVTYRRVSLVEAKSWKILQTFDNMFDPGFYFTKDNRYFIVYPWGNGTTRLLQIWDINNLIEREVIVSGDLCYSPDESIVGLYNDKSMNIWSTAGILPEHHQKTITVSSRIVDAYISKTKEIYLRENIHRLSIWSDKGHWIIKPE
jgi:hypothetical protein